MQRLIPEEVAKLFEKHNIKPKTGSYFKKWIPTSDNGYYRSLYFSEVEINKDDVDACCGIGICFYDMGIFKVDSLNKLDISDSYRASFGRGFDDYENYKYKIEFANSGYEDGWKTAQIVFNKDKSNA